jgi:hypothetical protein
MPAEKIQISPVLHQNEYTITYHDSNNVEEDVVFTGTYGLSTSEVIVPTWTRA